LRECPTLIVENGNYNTVTIYNDSGTRLGQVQGFQTSTLTTCAMRQRAELYRIVGWANSFALSLRGQRGYLQPNDTTIIEIGPSHHLSFIR